MQNITIPLVAPYRMPPFVDMSRLDVAIAVYIIELPMLYSGVCYLTTYSIHFAFINDICANLVMLSHRIKNLEINGAISVHEAIGRIVEKHIVIMQ